MQDAEIANIITTRLRQDGFDSLIIQNEFSLVDTLRTNLQNRLDASDYFIVLISKNALHSNWIQYELKTAISNDWSQREIMVLPIKIKPCNMPTYLNKIPWIDLTKNFDNGLVKLIEQLEMATQIDLRKRDEFDLHNLTIDLLKAYGFKDVKQKHSFGNDFGYDLIARFPQKDPFGRIEEEMWAVEIKAAELKTELSSLRRFIVALTMFNEPVKGLYITSGQLSSDAKAWLNQQKMRKEASISILDGNDLKRLILKKKKIAAKYFNG